MFVSVTHFSGVRAVRGRFVSDERPFKTSRKYTHDPDPIVVKAKECDGGYWLRVIKRKLSGEVLFEGLVADSKRRRVNDLCPKCLTTTETPALRNGPVVIATMLMLCIESSKGAWICASHAPGSNCGSIRKAIHVSVLRLVPFPIHQLHIFRSCCVGIVYHYARTVCAKALASNQVVICI